MRKGIILACFKLDCYYNEENTGQRFKQIKKLACIYISVDKCNNETLTIIKQRNIGYPRARDLKRTFCYCISSWLFVTRKILERNTCNTRKISACIPLFLFFCIWTFFFFIFSTLLHSTAVSKFKKKNSRIREYLYFANCQNIVALFPGQVEFFKLQNIQRYFFFW